MDLIKIENLNLHNGLKDILRDGQFRILEGSHYGLIGANGSGKTTLIKLLLDEIQPDKGIILRKPALKIGYLPQQPEFDPEEDIKNFLLSDLTPILQNLENMEMEMSRKTDESLEWLLSAYQKETEKFESMGGYSAIDRGEVLIRRLGMDNPLDQKLETLSGGERSLIFFAKALLCSPELLILDEPGNHLDYLGLAWLEAFLAEYKESVLIVSHNRYLLDKTCPNIMEIENGKLAAYTGSYSDFRRDKIKNLIHDQAEYLANLQVIDELTKKIKQLQSIATSQYNPPASVMSQLGAAKRKLAEARDKNLEKPASMESGLRLDFGSGVSKSRIAMEIKNFNMGFPDRILFKEADLDIYCGEKTALVGPNGSGKTTFLKTILENGNWNEKGMRIGPSQKIGYLSQQPEYINSENTLGEEILSWGPLSKDGAFKIARNFDFSYTELDKPLKVLSGGEGNRLQLARLMYEENNFLILDEPTNHMDIKSREVIEEALLRYKGTLLLISHDRFFLDKLVTRIVEINDLSFISWEGNFSSYFKQKYPVLPRIQGTLTRRGQDRKRESIPENKDSVIIEKRIEEAEKNKLKLETAMEEALAGNNQLEGRQAAAKLEKLSHRLEKLYREWEEFVN